MLQKQTYVVRHKTTLRALICSYGRHFCECPCELTLGRETKTEISCEWNTKFSIIPEIPLKRVHSKRIPKFSKTFTGIFTVPFSFGPEISEILVEWKAPSVLQGISVPFLLCERCPKTGILFCLCFLITELLVKPQD